MEKITAKKRETTEQAIEEARDRVKAEIASGLEHDLNFDRVARDKKSTFKDLLEAA